MTDIREPENAFQPDWRLAPPAALACHLRIAMSRVGISWEGKLDTDAEWERIALTIIDGLKNDRISPIKFVEMPRAWDAPSNPHIREKRAKEAAAYLREEADFNRSWTDGRRGSHQANEGCIDARLEHARLCDGWVDAIETLLLSAIGYREMRAALADTTDSLEYVAKVAPGLSGHGVRAERIMAARAALSKERA